MLRSRARPSLPAMRAGAMRQCLAMLQAVALLQGGAGLAGVRADVRMRAGRAGPVLRAERAAQVAGRRRRGPLPCAAAAAAAAASAGGRQRQAVAAGGDSGVAPRRDGAAAPAPRRRRRRVVARRWQKMGQEGGLGACRRPQGRQRGRCRQEAAAAAAAQRGAPQVVVLLAALVGGVARLRAAARALQRRAPAPPRLGRAGSVAPALTVRCAAGGAGVGPGSAAGLQGWTGACCLWRAASDTALPSRACRCVWGGQVSNTAGVPAFHAQGGACSWVTAHGFGNGAHLGAADRQVQQAHAQAAARFPGAVRVPHLGYAVEQVRCILRQPGQNVHKRLRHRVQAGFRTRRLCKAGHVRRAVAGNTLHQDARLHPELHSHSVAQQAEGFCLQGVQATRPVVGENKGCLLFKLSD